MHQGDCFFFRMNKLTRRIKVGKSYLLGSGQNVDIHIRRPGIANKHCLLICQPGGIKLIDQRDASITDQDRISEDLLKPGSTGQLGITTFTLFRPRKRPTGIGAQGRRDLQSAYRLNNLAQFNFFQSFTTFWRHQLPTICISLAVHIIAISFLWPHVLNEETEPTIPLLTNSKDLTQPQEPPENTTSQPPEEAFAMVHQGHMDEQMSNFSPLFMKTNDQSAEGGKDGAISKLIGLKTLLSSPAFFQSLRWGRDTGFGGNTSGHGQSRNGKGLSLAGRLQTLGGTTNAFRQKTRNYIKYKLETILVIDQTMSMNQGLQLVKSSLLITLDALCRLIPDYKVGLVTFKDPREKKEGAITVLKPSPEPWRILNRIQLLKAEGGGLPAESTLIPLRLAINTFSNTPNCRRTLIFIGNGPGHREEKEELLELVNQFGRNNGMLFTAFTPNTLGSKSIASDVLAEHRSLSALTGGKSIKLTSNSKNPAALLLDFFLRGISRQDAIKVMKNLIRFPPCSRKVICRRLQQNGSQWLIDQLLNPPIGINLIENAIDLLPPQGINTLIKQLNQPLIPLAGRQAALYIILNRITSQPVLTPQELDQALLQPGTIQWLSNRIK